MSQVSRYNKTIQDIELLIQTAEKEFNYKVERGEQTVKLFGTSSIQAIASILIDGWRYPIAITAEGEVLYDHFGSKSNTMEKLGKLLQKYSIDLIVNNLPRDKVKTFFMTTVKDTGEYKLVLQY